jgi:hydroxyacylglutathione hydrolase
VIEKVVEGVLWIPGRDKFLPDSHTYVIGKPETKDFTLVDAGLMEMGSFKIEALESAGIPLSQVKRIIMTHTHLDHVGCLPELIQAIPHMEVWVHKDEAGYLERGDEEVVFGNRMFETMIRSQFKIPKDFFKIKVHRRLEDGEVLDLGGVTFRVIHVPGHSGGSIGLFNEQHKLFMSGDTIYADGAIGRYDLATANPAALRKSLELIAKLGIDILLPCHNRIVKGGAAPMVKNTVRQWAPLLED